MKNSLLAGSRIWHRRIGSFLFAFFGLIALTGLMLGWKSIFSTTVFSAPAPTSALPTAGEPRHWLPLDTLQLIAAKALVQRTGEPAGRPGKAEARLANGYIEFQFKPDYYVRVQGQTGAVTLIQHRYGGWIQDIHDGSIVDGWIKAKGEIVKKMYSTVIGLALLFLTVSGFYLWYKPMRIKAARR